ncbi:MAG: YceI family protein [Deltaproteobacteria bacterium]|nr:YceI family protein [Deltaproteobacteria bacterium]MCB9787304.1 YceI family protein [Deltaproteobacteria bacterium]
MIVRTAQIVVTSLAGLALMATGALAETTTFKMSPEQGGLNRVVFENDAPFEVITGITNAVSGEVKVDLANPSMATGTVSIPVDSIKTGIPTRDEHLQGEQWLDAKAHPQITFEIDKIDTKAKALKPGEKVEATVHGKITIKGVTKPVKAKAFVTYRKATEETKKVWIKTDVLVIRAVFTLNIRDFGIIPPEHLAGVKVADQVEVKVSLSPAM